MSSVWFDGSIPEAVVTSKKSSKLFLVYISDGESSAVDLWENEELQSTCRNNCICLKIEKASPSCQQFSQIYPVVIVPVVYIIGNAGMPLEIIPGEVSATDLIQKINKAYEANLTANNLVAQQQASAPSPNQENDGTTSSSAQDDSAPTEQQQNDSAASISTPSTSTTEEVSQEPAQQIEEPSVSSEEDKKEKAARLQEKMDRIRLEKLQKEQEDERRREIERRELGKNMQEFKEKQQLLKRKKELEERRREKEEEKAALKRVREEIARDRAEKAQRYKKEKSEQEEKKQKVLDTKAQAAAVAAQIDYAEKCKNTKLQYRLPDGSTVVRDYPSETTLAEAIQDLRRQPVPYPPTFRLAMGIPRRVFSAEDEEKTLTELGLPPRASLAVHPYDVVSAPQRRGGPSVVEHVWAFVILVLNIPIKLVTSLWSGLFGGPTRDSVDQSAANLSHKYPAPPKPTTSSARSNDNEGPRVRRGGNMHRLHDTKRDSDDENTWNGNSTQQM